MFRDRVVFGTQESRASKAKKEVLRTTFPGWMSFQHTLLSTAVSRSDAARIDRAQTSTAALTGRPSPVESPERLCRRCSHKEIFHVLEKIPFFFPPTYVPGTKYYFGRKSKDRLVFILGSKSSLYLRPEWYTGINRQKCKNRLSCIKITTYCCTVQWNGSCIYFQNGRHHQACRTWHLVQRNSVLRCNSDTSPIICTRTSADPGCIVADAVRFRQLSLFRRVPPVKVPKGTFCTPRTDQTDHDLSVGV